MGGNIFALQLSQPKPQEVTPITGVPFASGSRAIMTVRTIWAKIQTTVIFGNSLYMIWYNIGQLSPQDGFVQFLRPLFGKEVLGVELTQPPFAATPALYTLVGIGVPLPPPPVATQPVKMLHAGFDPLRGYWIEFAGNYFLPAPNGFTLFQDWPDVIRETDNYKGFQPSANNPQNIPGGGGSNGGGTPQLPPTTC